MRQATSRDALCEGCGQGEEFGVGVEFAYELWGSSAAWQGNGGSAEEADRHGVAQDSGASVGVIGIGSEFGDGCVWQQEEVKALQLLLALLAERGESFACRGEF